MRATNGEWGRRLCDIVVMFKENVAVRLQIFQNNAGTARHRRERVVRHVHRHLKPLRKELVEAFKKRAAAHEHDAGAHDVGKYLGRRGLQDFAHALNQRVDGLRDGFADILVGNNDLARQAR